MNKKFSPHKKAEPVSVAVPLIICAVAAVAGRLSGIISSYFATDIMYEGTVVTTVLPYFPMILQAVSFAAVAVAVAHCIKSMQKCAPAFLLYTAVLLADAVAVILYDTLSGYYDANYSNVGVEFYTYIILYRLMVAAFSLLMIFISWCIMKMLIGKGLPLTLLSVAGALVPVAVDLIAVIVRSVGAMIDREFVLLDSEISAILLDVGMILICAAAAVVTAVILNIVLKKRKTES